MKVGLDLSCNILLFLGSCVLLMAGALAIAAPVESNANSCTFVGAVVNPAAQAGTETGSGYGAALSTGGVTESLGQAGGAVSGDTTSVGNCDVVRFSTQSAHASGSGENHRSTQKFLRMTTIFDGQDMVEFDVTSIFDIMRPTTGAAIFD